MHDAFRQNEVAPTVPARGFWKVHYHLQGGIHHMDALVRNQAERELLAVVQEVASALDIPLQIGSAARGEGGVEDYLTIFSANKEAIALAVTLLGALFSAPLYREKVRQSRQQSVMNDLTIQKMRLEITEKEDSAQRREVEKTDAVKTKALPLESAPTVEQVAIALLGRRRLAHHRSNYYAELMREPRIEAVGYAASHARGAPEVQVARADFGAFIVDQAPIEPERHLRIPMEIVSPVLRRESIKWRGIFNKKVISFELADAEFRGHVAAGLVQFQCGTTLVCDLEIRLEEDDCGKVEVTGYVVTQVHGVRQPLPNGDTAITVKQMLLNLGERDGLATPGSSEPGHA